MKLRKKKMYKNCLTKVKQRKRHVLLVEFDGRFPEAWQKPLRSQAHLGVFHLC